MQTNQRPMKSYLRDFRHTCPDPGSGHVDRMRMHRKRTSRRPLRQQPRRPLSCKAASTISHRCRCLRPPAIALRKHRLNPMPIDIHLAPLRPYRHRLFAFLRPMHHLQAHTDPPRHIRATRATRRLTPGLAHNIAAHPRHLSNSNTLPSSLPLPNKHKSTHSHPSPHLGAGVTFETTQVRPLFPNRQPESNLRGESIVPPSESYQRSPQLPPLPPQSSLQAGTASPHIPYASQYFPVSQALGK